MDKIRMSKILLLLNPHLYFGIENEKNVEFKMLNSRSMTIR